MLAILLALLGGGLVVGLASSKGETSPAADPETEPAPTPPVADAPPPPPPPTPPVPPEDGDDGEAPVGEVPDVPDNEYDIGWAGLSAEEQLIVELINRARMDPNAEVNRLNDDLASGQSSDPVQPLAVIAALSDAARAHSEDMDNREFFAHTNPDGQSPGVRAEDAGYGSRYVGENIGWVGSSRQPDAQPRAEGHHSNLWSSDGHQRNLLGEDWSEVGLGYDYGDHTSGGYNYTGSTFVTELFGDKGNTFLTGVVIDDEDGDEFYDIGEGQGDVKITAYDGDEAFTTATWDSGGYTLALPSGTYRVVFEGGDLDRPYETNVTIGNENVKLDVIEENGALLASVSAGMVANGPDATALMTEPFAETLAFVEEPEETPELVLM